MLSVESPILGVTGYWLVFCWCRIVVTVLSFLATLYLCWYSCYVVIIPGYYVLLSLLSLLLLSCYHSWPLLLAVVVLVVLITSCQPSRCCCCSRTLSFSRKQSWCCRSPAEYSIFAIYAENMQNLQNLQNLQNMQQSGCRCSPSCYTPRAATCRRCSHCRASQRSSESFFFHNFGY